MNEEIETVSCPKCQCEVLDLRAGEINEDDTQTEYYRCCACDHLFEETW